MFGLGKQRSKFGKWVDNTGIKQNDIAKSSSVGRTTISDMCSDKEHIPKISTWVKVQKALNRMGYEVEREDFFNL